MASWKEKGVVPDSDDEDEFESQTLSLQHGNEGRNDAVRHYTIEEERIDLLGHGGLVEDQNTPAVEDPAQDLEAITQQIVARRTSQRPDSLKPYIGSQNANLPSSPVPPKVFKVPELFWDENELEDHNGQSSNSIGNLPEEEISRSYVQITSPGSSILSSPPDSQQLPPLDLPKPHNTSAPFEEKLLEQSTVEEAQSGPISTQEDPVYPMKRALRQRNPIQLHPYIVEQEKYRQTLKARGIAPMRIALSQDERHEKTRDSSSPDPDTQDVDSQEIAINEPESQAMDFDWDPPISSSPVPPNLDMNKSGSVKDIAQPVNADDEFPDVEDLFKTWQRSVPRSELKRTKKSYSKKFKRHNISNSPLRNSPHRILESLNTPASPPPTSSPIVSSTRRIPQPPPRIGLGVIKESISISTAEDGIRENADLPTPATSATKPNPDPIFLDSSSDSDDPFASDPRHSSSPESSSDESIQLRRVGKKIRGVLPASHLRLDIQKKKPRAQGKIERDAWSVSPVKGLARKGVALPRNRNDTRSTPISAFPELPFLSDDSEDENEENRLGGFGVEDDSVQLNTIFDESRLGLAEEQDSIDAMLPSWKRQSSNSSRTYKKRKVDGGTRNKHQPRITEHLKRSRNAKSTDRPSKRQKYNRTYPGKSKMTVHHSAPPKLSILDVVNSDRRDCNIPQFIRIAARAAKSQKDLGRQSPTRKFIRLPTREDTQDAQSVLEDWRGGKITPKILTSQPIDQITFRTPLSELNNNRQADFPTLPSKTTPPIRNGGLGVSKISLSRRGIQQSMDNFVTQTPIIRLPKRNSLLKTSLGRARQPRYQEGQIPARPAQLESSGIEFSRRHPSAAFKSTKRVLDALYRNSHKRAAPYPNLQLSRFLADEAIVRQSIKIGNDDVESQLNVKVHPPQKLLRRRKRSPKRIDAEAATYRQPSHPLVLDLQMQEKAQEEGDGNKLRGLGKFGTKYPIHFDILPLQQGIFFHESTILGMGCLRNVIHGNDDVQSIGDIGSLKLMEMEFSWASWDEAASSEIGICFDWILEQLLAKNVPISSQSSHMVEVVKFVTNYVQFHVRFDGPLGRKNFLSRMVSVIQEFSSRLQAKDKQTSIQIKSAVEVLSICTMLVFVLLKMSRIDPEPASLVYELEDLLKSVASCCIHFLLIEGLESIRKLYDDLQYLSFQETGIRNDQYALQAWVILIQILTAASIPRGSFWDITNFHLDLVATNNLNDAPAMENLWYTLYTLLPLCEFDEFGVAIPGLRETNGFDNWAIPQQMLKRLSSLYKENQRQPPGFNDYCKSVFTRCHYLMIQWGWWKCSGIIGTMFDFFASQNLSHLRNEEVYHSPHFLGELDTEPSLAIELDDCCFHIFLKVTALGIKHLRCLNDTKSIRNLVTRILPNHDRQYPKEEAVHQRDLASLRNHHDLLCTLFWTAPPDQRPPVSLIQELVAADRSHKEACLINLRAWENLSRFVVTSSVDPEMYRPFIVWQLSFFDAIYQQYTSAETEVRQQAEVLQRQTGEVMSEVHISNTVLANKRSIIVSMSRSVNAMGNIIRTAKSDTMVKQALNCGVLSKALDPIIYVDKRIPDSLLKEVVLALNFYMDQTDQLCPITLGAPNESRVNNGDSQDSLDLAEANWGRLELKIPLSSVLESLSPVIRKRLEATNDNDQSTSLIIIDCWARLISMLTEDEPKKFSSFLMNGNNAIFENRNTYNVANESWPLFLAKLLERNKTFADFPAGFNIGLEWLISLTNAQPISTANRMLTFQLYKKGHYLCTVPELHTFDRITIIRAAIRRMSTLLLENSTNSTVGLSQKPCQRLFSDMLGEVMKAVQQVLESLEPNSGSHKLYLEFAQAVVTDIKCYASDFRPLTEFFVHPSASYWPHDADPNLYAAGIVAYSIRLSQQPERTSFELFYYLHGGWKSALITGQIQNYFYHIKKGMRRWDFVKFMLSEFIPSILDAGFRASGWLLCQTFLPALSQRVGHLLDQIDHNTEWIFESLINILKTIMNGTKALFRRYQHNMAGINPDHRGILVIVFRFWFSIAPYMRQYTARYPSKKPTLDEVTDPLSSFIYHSIQAFRSGDLDAIFSFPSGEFDIMRGKFTEKFTAVILQDIRDHWQFIDENGFGVVVSSRLKEQSPPQLLTETLSEVLESGVEVYEALFEDKEGLQLPERTRRLVMDVFC